MSQAKDIKIDNLNSSIRKLKHKIAKKQKEFGEDKLLESGHESEESDILLLAGEQQMDNIHENEEDNHNLNINSNSNFKKKGI